MIRRFSFEIFPTQEQIDNFWEHIGAYRYIWNYMLAIQRDRLAANETLMNGYDMAMILKELKTHEDLDWLNKVSNYTLRQACLDLNTACKKFTKRGKPFPEFRNRATNEPCFPFNNFCLTAQPGITKVHDFGEIACDIDAREKLPIRVGQKVYHAKIACNNNKQHWYIDFTLGHD